MGWDGMGWDGMGRDGIVPSHSEPWMESRIDQDKISEEDFTFLINAFDKIQCTDAAKLLRGDSLFF
jgi:hypothetical protein